MTKRTIITLVRAAAALTVGAALGGCGANATPISSSTPRLVDAACDGCRRELLLHGCYAADRGDVGDGGTWISSGGEWWPTVPVMSGSWPLIAIVSAR